MAFPPWGYDASAWVYRTRAGSHDYFLKVRRGAVNVAGLAVPRYLYDRGIERVVAPLPTAAGTLWAGAGGYALSRFPFVAGASGRERGMTAGQWVAYGALLCRVHDTAVDADLARLLRRDDFAPEGAETIGGLDARLGAYAGDDAAEREVAVFWRDHRPEIRALLARSEAPGRRLARAAPPAVLCHADIHTANVLLDGDERIGFVDWDEATLAPRERDLMFAIGGIGAGWVGPDEEARFLKGYDDIAVDPLALAYYRHAWAVGDIGAFGTEACCRPDLGPATRRAAAESLTALFRPGEIVALARAAG